MNSLLSFYMTGLRFFTNKHPVPSRIQLAISDDDNDELNSEEVENIEMQHIEMQPLVVQDWPWKKITTV